MAHLLKNTYKDEKLEQLLVKKADSDIVKLRKAVDRLRWASIPAGTDGELRQLSDELVNHRMDDVETDYREQAQRMMMAGDTVAEAMRRYSDVRDELLQCVKTVRNILTTYGTVHFKFSSDGRAFFSEQELRGYISQKSLRKYDETDKQLYSMLGDLADALDKLHTYEHVHRLIAFTDRLIGSVYEPLSNLYDFDRQHFQMNPTLYNQMLDAGLVGEAEISESDFKSRHNQV